MQPINPAFPMGEVRSVAELMDIALGMEEEAARRYEQLAEAVGRTGDAELVQVFRDLADLERRHAAGIAAWSERESGRRPVGKHFTWHFPETFGPEADGAEARLLTPYRALGIAVRNEERAFAFYAYVAAQAENEAVRQYAEAMAREELEHVATLRTMRRRAYHAEEGPRRPRPVVNSATELHALAAGLGRTSARVYDLAADSLARAGDAAAAGVMRQAAAQESAAAKALARGPEGTAADVASEAVEGAQAAGLLRGDLLTPLGALTLALRNAEAVFDIFMRVAERAGDEALMREAQELANGAVERLALVRSLMGENGD